MKTFINFWHRFFKEKPSANLRVNLSTLSLLTGGQDAELNCDQVFALIDQFAERAARGEDVAHLMPLVAAHLEMCPDCREQYETLERVLKAG